MQTVLDIKGIMEIIPHRHPFLLIDKVIEIKEDHSQVIAIKNTSLNHALAIDFEHKDIFLAN